MLFLLRSFLLLSVATSTFLIAQVSPCVSPKLTPPPPVMFTDEQQRILGEVVAEQMQSGVRVLPALELNEHLQTIAMRLLRSVGAERTQVQFLLVDGWEANAYTLPGGHVYVTRKLIASTRNDDELAAVVGHELGHALALDPEANTSRLFQRVLKIGEVTGRRDIYARFHELIENMNRRPELLEEKIDREQHAADQLGYAMAVAAGYSPSAPIQIFDRLAGTKGKTGNVLGDLFGTTKPEQRRLRQVIKELSVLGVDCGSSREQNTGDFNSWKATVLSYEVPQVQWTTHGLVSQHVLSPPLRSGITTLRFSRDGRYLLAQDKTTIRVLTREPLQQVLQLHAPYAKPASFTPDSSSVVFHTPDLRIQRWSVRTGKREEVHLLGRSDCIETELSPDGRYLACENAEYDLEIVDTASGDTIFSRRINDVATWNTRRLLLASLAFSPDARFLVFSLGHTRGAVELATVKALSWKEDIFGELAFVADDQFAALKTGAPEIALIRLPSGETVSRVPVPNGVSFAKLQGGTSQFLVCNYHPSSGWVTDDQVATLVLDVANKKVMASSRNRTLAIYGDVYARERLTGTLGLFRLADLKPTTETELPVGALAELNAFTVSPNLNWIGLSAGHRGIVWNVGEGKAEISELMAFAGGIFDSSNVMYVDYPEADNSPRAIVRYQPDTRRLSRARAVPSNSSVQLGEYLIVLRPERAGHDIWIENSTRDSFLMGEPHWLAVTGEKLLLETQDVATGRVLWSRSIFRQGPLISVRGNSMVIAWDASGKYAKSIINENDTLRSRLKSLSSKEGIVLVEVVDASTGKTSRTEIIDTGRASFSISCVTAVGKYLVVTDDQNRVLVYESGAESPTSRFFGQGWEASEIAGLIAIENATGTLAIYPIAGSGEPQSLQLPARLLGMKFSPDGRRLLLLTSDQKISVLQLASLGTPKQ